MKTSQPTENQENPRRNFIKTAAKGGIAALSISSLAASAFAADKVIKATETEVPPV
jgi:hypothetical protein